MTPKEFITHEPGDIEAWVCKCGNMPDQDGFVPCDENGNEIEPSTASTWANLYVCAKCGTIINQHTLEVVGQSANFKHLD